MKNWKVRKQVVARDDMPEEHRLHQSLSWPHLIALGVGAIVGTGILTLTGVGAAKAGPAEAYWDARGPSNAAISSAGCTATARVRSRAA